jgi:hypothetical protein
VIAARNLTRSPITFLGVAPAVAKGATAPPAGAPSWELSAEAEVSEVPAWVRALPAWLRYVERGAIRDYARGV